MTIQRHKKESKLTLNYSDSLSHYVYEVTLHYYVINDGINYLKHVNQTKHLNFISGLIFYPITIYAYPSHKRATSATQREMKRTYFLQGSDVLYNVKL